MIALTMVNTLFSNCCWYLYMNLVFAVAKFLEHWGGLSIW